MAVGATTASRANKATAAVAGAVAAALRKVRQAARLHHLHLRHHPLLHLGLKAAAAVRPVRWADLERWAIRLVQVAAQALVRVGATRRDLWVVQALDRVGAIARTIRRDRAAAPVRTGKILPDREADPALDQIAILRDRKVVRVGATRRDRSVDLAVAVIRRDHVVGLAQARVGAIHPDLREDPVAAIRLDRAADRVLVPVGAIPPDLRVARALDRVGAAIVTAIGAIATGATGIGATAIVGVIATAGAIATGVTTAGAIATGMTVGVA